MAVSVKRVVLFWLIVLAFLVLFAAPKLKWHGDLPQSGDLLSPTEASPSHVESKSDVFDVLPFEHKDSLVSLENLIAQAKQRLRIFIYDLGPISSIPGIDMKPFRNLNCPAQYNRASTPRGGFTLMFASELIFPMILKQSVIVTTNPEEADLFFVPQNTTCVFTHFLFYHKMYIYAQSAQKMTQTYFIPLMKHIATAWPYFNRRNGADHVFLFPQDFATQEIMTSQGFEWVKNSIRIQTWGDGNSEHFERGRDIVIPPLICDKNLAMKLEALNAVNSSVSSELSRPILALFAGNPGLRIQRGLAYSKGVRQRMYSVYYNATFVTAVRRMSAKQTLNQLQYTPQILYVPESLGSAFFDVGSHCRFMICPGGNVLWSPRPFEAMAMGMLPVVISDGIIEPFEDLIDWRTFAYKVNNSQATTLREVLADFNAQTAIIASKLNALKAVTRFLTWTLDDLDAESSTSRVFDLIYAMLCIRANKCTQPTKVSHEGEIAFATF